MAMFSGCGLSDRENDIGEQGEGRTAAPTLVPSPDAADDELFIVWLGASATESFCLGDSTWLDAVTVAAALVTVLRLLVARGLLPAGGSRFRLMAAGRFRKAI